MDPPANIPSAREMGKILLEFCAVKSEVDSLIKILALRYEMIVEQIKVRFDSELKFIDYFDEVKRLIYDARGNYDKALENYSEALKIDEQLGDLLGKANILNNIGMIYSAKRDYQNALTIFQQALDLYRKLGLKKDAEQVEEFNRSIK